MGIISKVITMLPGMKRLLRKRYLNKRKKEINKNGAKVLEKICMELKKHDVTVFADFGTLLGIIRNGRLISWDDDIDFGIIFHNDFGWNELEAVMNSLGYKKQYSFELNGETTEQNYANGYISIDFFQHKTEGNNSVVYAYDRYKEKKYPDEKTWSVKEARTIVISGSKEMTFDGYTCTVPLEAEEYLADIYGEDWRIPNPNWESGSGPCARRINDLYGYYVSNDTSK